MTTPTDTAKLADEIEALAKDATPGPWFQWPTKDGGRVCAPFPVEGEEPLSVADFDMDRRLDYDTTSCANAALVSRLSQSLSTIIAALRELDAAHAREAKLREALGQIDGMCGNIIFNLTQANPAWQDTPKARRDEYVRAATTFRKIARAALGGAG